MNISRLDTPARLSSRRQAVRRIAGGGLAAALAATLGPRLARAHSNEAATPGPDSHVRPSDGFTLHIDAKFHFAGDPEAICHHWCKPISDELIECQLYDSDESDARLVGVETVVPTATWQTFDAAEQALWHYHREEIPLVEATLPDLSAEEAAPIAESLQETYGKLWILWDPTVTDMPVGQPFVFDIHSATGHPPTS